MYSSSVTTTLRFLYQSSAAKPQLLLCLLFSANQIIELELTLIDMVHTVPDATWLYSFSKDDFISHFLGISLVTLQRVAKVSLLLLVFIF